MKSFALLVLSALVLPAAAEEPKAVLLEHGVKVLGSTLVMEQEGDFRSQLNSSTKLRRGLNDAAKRLAIAEQQMLELKRNIAALTETNVSVNAQLSNTNPNNTALYNRLVGANNANLGLLRLRQDQLKAGEKQLDEIRAAAMKAQEDFVTFVLEARTLADSIEARRQQAAADAAVQAAVRELNEAESKEYTLDEPSRAFSQAVRKLEDLEALVLSEEITLRRNSGGTLLASVIVNGEDAVEMTVDSGASIIVLPDAMAQKLNVVPGPSDPRITLILADGGQIVGTQLVLKSVRVGQFEVEDVECAVLGPDAPNAEPLLGMSFLKAFEFRINSAEATLTLTRVGEEREPARRRDR